MKSFISKWQMILSLATRFFNSKWCLFGILLAATILRLYRIGEYMTFLGDEGRDSLVIYNILHGKLTLLGPTASVGGFFMGPFYYYLATPFLWLSNYNVVGPSIMVALVGVATVWLIYAIGKSLFGRGAGIIAAFFYAIAPIVIVYSRASWNPNVMPFFTLLTLISLFQAFKRKNIWLFLLTGFLYGLDIQLHYTELFLGVTIMLYVFFSSFFEKQKTAFFAAFVQTMKFGLFLLFGFAIGFSPFLAFEVRHGFLNTKGILAFIFQSGETGASPNLFLTMGSVLFRLFARLLTNFPLPEHYEGFDKTTLYIWAFSAGLVMVICIIQLFLRLVASWKNKRKGFQELFLLSLWLVIGVIFFGLYKKQIYDYYLEYLFPLPFLLIGMGLSDLYSGSIFNRKLSRFSFFNKAVVIIAFSLIFWVNFSYTPVRYQPNNIVGQTKQIAQFIIDKANGKPFNFAIISGSNSDHAYIYFMTIWGKTPITIERYDLDPQRKSVTDQLFVVCESLPCDPLKDYVWKIAFFGKAKIAGEWDVSVVKIYKLVHDDQK